MDHLAVCGSNLLKLGGCLHFTLIHNPEGFLGAKSTSIRDCVGRLVGPSVPTMQLRGKLVTSQLIREEEEEEENWLRRDSITSQFLRT
jgi:hypothetical protein